MNINKKALGILAILAFIAVASLFVLRPVTEENKQPVFEYTVRADDTCAKIAVGFSVSVVSIVEANHLNKDCSNIYLGQVLFVPYPTPLGSPVATIRSIVIDCDREIYTVKADDTLETISNQYNVPKDAIAFFNGLSEDKVKAGTQLAIPLCYLTPSP